MGLTQVYMINKIIKQWVFINYCGQKIGQFRGADLKLALLNVTTLNVSFIIYGIIFFIFIKLGFKNVYLYLLISISFEFLVIRKFVKKYLDQTISISELQKQYKITHIRIRILFFLLSILLVILSVILFIVIISSLKYF